MSQALRKITGSLSRSNCLLIFINQIRQKVGILFGNPEVTPGAPVSRGTVLGTVRDIFGRAIDCYRAEKDGIILYMTVSLAVKAGTPLVAYG